MINKLIRLYRKSINRYKTESKNITLDKKEKSDYEYLKAMGVDTELGFVKLIGKPIIQRYPNSIIKIEEGVTLVSETEGNIAGISHPVILATLAEGAVIHIGKDSGISGSTICAAKSVKIGEYVGVGVNTSIYDTDFHAKNPYLRKYGSINDISTKEILIDDFSWIGGHCIILKGVKLGKCAVVGAGSVVSKSIPEFTVCAGNPAIVIGKVEINEHEYDALFGKGAKKSIGI